jgi:hypothetical protein
MTCISDNLCLYAGEIIVKNYTLGTFPNNATFIDKVILAEGYYRFVLMDSAGDGLIAPAICFVELIGSASIFNDTIEGVFNITSTEVFEVIEPTEMPSSKPSTKPSSKPITPVSPVKPITPGLPVKPIKPALPVKPNAPVSPMKPITPAKKWWRLV